MWTNDLVLNGKKLSGTLTELSLEGESGALQYAVIGIGVNCNNTLEDFPPELRDVATSLYLETGKRVQRAALAAALIEELLTSSTPRCKAATRRPTSRPTAATV